MYNQLDTLAAAILTFAIEKAKITKNVLDKKATAIAILVAGIATLIL